MEKKLIGEIFGIKFHSPIDENEVKKLVQKQLKEDLDLSKHSELITQFLNNMPEKDRADFEKLHAECLINAPKEWIKQVSPQENQNKPYVRKIEEKTVTDNLQVKPKTNYRIVLGFVNLIIILICLVLILFKCTSSNEEPQKAAKKDSQYMTECQKMIELETKHPSSVVHKRMATSVNKAANGNIMVLAPFKAKNDYGLEIDHKARCIFSPDGTKEIKIM